MLCLARTDGLGIGGTAPRGRPNSAIVAPDAEVNDGIHSLIIRIEPLRWSTPFLRVVLTAACVGALATPVQAGPYLLVEAETGRVISQSDAGQPWYPASVTKLMTTYVAFRAMRDGKIGPNSLLRVSANAQAQPPSKMGFNVGTEITLDNAIKMLMVRSANDIAVVIAEGVGGSVEAFVNEMNLTAGRLGMNGTRFVNPHGLPDDNQVTSARDMAMLARAMTREFPEYELYFRIPAIQLGKRIIRNHNRLIDRYPGADGMKTGFICSSGFNVVASAGRGGKRLIAVVFGSYSAAQRAEDAARLFERGFSRDVLMARMSDYEVSTLDAIRNVGGNPTDLRDQMCNPKRKRPVAESDFDDEDEEIELPANSKSAAKSKQPKPVKHSLLVDLPASMPPIRVFTGLLPKASEAAITTAPKTEKAATAKTEKANVSTTKPVTPTAGSQTKADDTAKSATKTAAPAEPKAKK
jgi:D-alanyl-D-alanine carboxypeptidase